jgi:hypothetical protein
MIRSTLFLFVSTLALQAQAAPTSAMAYGGYSGLSAPMVKSVAVNAGHITLTGRFHGAGTPVVLLGQHRLEVSKSSRSQVTAALPQILPPATYRLLVNFGSTPANATVLYLKIPENAL